MLSNDDSLLMIHTDRLTAFDRYIAMVPFKGLILSELSRFWMEKVSTIVPTHFKKAANRRTLELEPCEPIKAEVIVRGYMAGSMMRAYGESVRVFCGQTLEENIKPYQALPSAIITPTSKAAAFEHDEETTAQDLINSGVCTESEWLEIESLAFALFKEGQRIYAEKGWILVDTKYEFGRKKNGEICVIDEIHTPDSSRLWIKSSYDQALAAGIPPEMLDKEIVRRYLLEKGFKGEGNVPDVPSTLLIELARTYLHVTQTMMQEKIYVEEKDTDILSILNNM
jgi:phosphoribosylaminoimidazole-succinocarboxamide synthase